MQHRDIRAYPHSVVIRMQPAHPSSARPHPFRRVSLLIIASFIAFPLLLQATSATANAQTTGSDSAQTPDSSVSAVSSREPLKTRVLALRRKESLEGARLLLTSDSPLDDYSSYVEGERMFVLLPSTAAAGAQSNLNGRGFTDMRVETRGHDLLISFRLQVGASVYFRQQFNRIELSFSTNERVSKN